MASSCSRLRDGRLLITCIEGQHVRGRADHDSQSIINPYLIFELTSSDNNVLRRKSDVGKNQGHDVDFGNCIVSFDLAEPSQFLVGGDVTLSVKIQDDSEDFGVIGEASLSMMEILTSESEFMKELKVLRPNDTTTNTVVRLKFHFIPAKKGMLKLYMHDLALAGLDRGLIVRASTPDGQSKSVNLNSLSTNDSMDFWVDSKNWFGDLSIVLQRESDGDTYLRLEPLSIIDFAARGRGRVSTQVHIASCMESDAKVSILDVHHEFLEAGLVRVELIELGNLPSDAASNVSDLRMILRSKGKVRRNELMTGAPIIDGKLRWKDDPISMPVVDEYTLLVECCEYDEVADDHEEVGMAEISLLPLFRDGSIETTVNLKHLTEMHLNVGFLGMPNAGKSTLLSVASAAKPKIANYPFTTITPNLGVCDLGEDSSGLVLCDIPGLIEGASQGTGLGFSFLRHVQRCKVLLHVVDGTSKDPVGDFNILNNELKAYDDMLGKKPQVVVLNKVDVPEVREKQEELLEQLREAAGHSRVMTISAATTTNVQELMSRLKKFVEAEKEKNKEELGGLEEDILMAEVDFSKAALDSDSDDYEITSDPAYPGQWRVKGPYIEQVAKMTHWEYPEAVERFGRQLQALGIADELIARGALEGDLVMIDEYDFDFSPGKTNPYIPQELLDKDAMFEEQRAQNGQSPRGMLLDSKDIGDDEEIPWTPFKKGGYMLMDKDEIVEFNEDGEWDLLDDDFDLSGEFMDGDDVWTS